MLRAVYQAVRRLNVIDVTRLMHWQGESWDRGANNPDYTFRSIQRSEMQRRIEDGSVPSMIGDAMSLAQGNRVCVAAIHADRVVSFLWIASDRVSSADNFSRSPHLGTSLILPHAGGFVFNAWTDPKHRGRGLIAELLGYVIRHRLLGTQSLWTTMDWTNASSRRAFEKIGMRSMGLIWRVGRGRFQVSWLPKMSPMLGVKIAEDAAGIILGRTH